MNLQIGFFPNSVTSFVQFYVLLPTNRVLLSFRKVENPSYTMDTYTLKNRIFVNLLSTFPEPG